MDISPVAHDTFFLVQLSGTYNAVLGFLTFLICRPDLNWMHGHPHPRGRRLVPYLPGCFAYMASNLAIRLARTDGGTEHTLISVPYQKSWI